MSGWIKTSDRQQVRSDGDTTLTIEEMDRYWFWSVSKGGIYITGDDTGEYANTEREAKILAEVNAI